MAAPSSSVNVACVWGANGISGVAMVDALIEQKRSQWNRIICISRRPTQLDVDDDRIYFISFDLLESSVNEIVTELEKAGGKNITHVYHFTYIEKQDENELDEVNKILLQKALNASIKVAGEHIKCVTLQTGYKVIHQRSNKTTIFSSVPCSIMVYTKAVNILQHVLIKKMLRVTKVVIFITHKKIY